MCYIPLLTLTFASNPLLTLRFASNPLLTLRFASNFIAGKGAIKQVVWEQRVHSYSRRMDLDKVEKYLMRGEYPAEFSKAEKANLRLRCKNNFKVYDGILKYRTARKQGEEAGVDDWRVCVRTKVEKDRVLESCHAGMAGMVLVCL